MNIQSLMTYSIMRKFILILVMVLPSAFAFCQESIVKKLSVENGEGNKVVVHQTSDTRDLVQSASDVAVGAGVTVDGFRLQIFSGNKGSKSRNMAYKIKEDIEKVANDVDIYVLYMVPFWRVQIGNCLTRNEANELKTSFLSKFPEYSDEAYIVPVKIQK